VTRTYTNPVYPRDFPDPFVLRFNGRYYAYATGAAGDGRYFPMLSSRDLVSWEPHGGALDPLDLPGAEEYWAPEVAYYEGRFYLYYAVGRGENPDHHLRLAVAELPLGPWRDAGVNLTPGEIFAIDAHPFRDPKDGQWYLYYARDELEPPFAGTGVVVDRLLSMDRLEGNPRPVVRPYAGWQVFELQRAVKSGLDWYTVEGPFTLRVDDRYICFYSGGRWENPSYGVGFACAGHPRGPWVDDVNAGGPRVLTTVPDRVIGPGHNSVVTGPDLVTQYIVYHGWDPGFTARFPRIDRLDWENGSPCVVRPSSDPMPVPPLPDLADWFDESAPGTHWGACEGWGRDEAGLNAAADPASLVLAEPVGDFIAELSVRGPVTDLQVLAPGLSVSIDHNALRAGDQAVQLPKGFRHDTWHVLSVQVRGGQVEAVLDAFLTVRCEAAAGSRVLEVEARPGTSLGHFALTRL